MKRDIILTCEYTQYNQKFFQKLKNCSNEELKHMFFPLFCDVCCLSFEKVESVQLDECVMKGGFLALTLTINEDNVLGTEHMYHSDMITFLDIHKCEYNEDPEKQFVVFENANHEQVFSTQIYPIFLKDVSEKLKLDIPVSDLWALLMKLSPSKKQLFHKLEKYEVIKEALKYR